MKKWFSVLLCWALLCGTLPAALGEAPALEASDIVPNDEVPSLEASSIGIDDLPLTIDDPLSPEGITLDSDLDEAPVVPEGDGPEDEQTPEGHEIREEMQPSLQSCVDMYPCIINSTTFPDPLFRKYIIRQFDTDGNGQLDYEWESRHGRVASFTGEAANVRTIKGLPSGIKSLQGIEYFPFLQTLDCSGMKLTSLDLSNNPCLQTLDCSNNQLFAIRFGAQDYVELKTIHCQDNELDSLDLTSQSTFQSWLDGHIAQMRISGKYRICEDNDKNGLRIDKGVRLILSQPEPVLSKSEQTICVGEMLQNVFEKKSPYNQSKYVYISIKGLKGRTYDQENGLWGITFSKRGRAVVTITSKYGESVRLNVTVVSDKPAFTAKRYTLASGEKSACILDGKQGPSAEKCTFKSSNAKVAAIDKHGIVKGLNPGTATVTATSFSGASATCKVRVQGKHRALLIGQSDYRGTKSDLRAPRTDANGVAGMLKGLADKYTCTVKYDLRAVDIGRAIDSAFKGATDDDVSLFFYSGHGCGDSLSSPNNGALVGVDLNLFLTRDLAEHLDAVKGRVIVLIDACRSGAFIQNNSGPSESPDPNAFNQAIIDALVGSASAPSSNSGELRKSKYIVITACRADQDSVETMFPGSNHYQGLFTTVLLDGMGCSYLKGRYLGSMPADRNDDGNITPAELASYIRTEVNNLTAGNRGIDQTAQYYYPNGKEVMFSRNK